MLGFPTMTTMLQGRRNRRREVRVTASSPFNPPSYQSRHAAKLSGYRRTITRLNRVAKNTERSDMSSTRSENRIAIYAELLSNLRQLSVVASLPSVSDSSTSACVSDDGLVLTVFHQGQNQSIVGHASGRG